MGTISEVLKQLDSTNPLAACKVIKNMLEHGHSSIDRDKDGVTPLHLAIMKGFSQVVQLLLEHGSEVNACSFLGGPHEHSSLEGTPLQTAVEYEENEIAKLLLSHGANPMIRSKAGDNPFLCAAMSGNVKIGKLLLDAGSDINCRAMPLEAGFYIPDETSLHIAVRYLNVPYVRFLLKNNINIDTRDGLGRMALDLVSGEGFKYLGLGPFPQDDYNKIKKLLSQDR